MTEVHNDRDKCIFYTRFIQKALNRKIHEYSLRNFIHEFCLTKPADATKQDEMLLSTEPDLEELLEYLEEGVRLDVLKRDPQKEGQLYYVHDAEAGDRFALDRGFPEPNSWYGAHCEAKRTPG